MRNILLADRLAFLDMNANQNLKTLALAARIVFERLSKLTKIRRISDEVRRSRRAPSEQTADRHHAVLGNRPRPDRDKGVIRAALAAVELRFVIALLTVARMDQADPCRFV